MRVLQISGSSM